MPRAGADALACPLSRALPCSGRAGVLNEAQGETETMYKHILIATDGSELAEKAALQGLELAKQLNAAVTAVTVTAPWPVAEAGGVIVQSPIKDYEAAVAE